jgi:hypothetical protein
MEKPYRDLEIGTGYVIREFNKNIDPIHLLWHRDNEQRLIEVLECGQGWKIQMDNKLPQLLEPNTTIFILRHQWHRVIKGEGTLLLKIHKNER